LGDGDGGRLPPIERLVRRHIKALHDFVRWVYPSVTTEPIVFEVFERAQRRMPTGGDQDVRLELFAEARAVIRSRNRPSWSEHNAHVVREGLRAQGDVMTDWHAWTDHNRLIDSLAQLTVAQQEVVQLITVYDDMGASEIAVVLRIGQRAAADLLDEATSALRAAFDDGDPTAHIGEADR
jgi:DNA-directed RNA polymerase specialized sigma24 family protein